MLSDDVVRDFARAAKDLVRWVDDASWTWNTVVKPALAADPSIERAGDVRVLGVLLQGLGDDFKALGVEVEAAAKAVLEQSFPPA